MSKTVIRGGAILDPVTMDLVPNESLLRALRR